MKHLLAVTAVCVYLPALTVCLPAAAWAQPREEARPKGGEPGDTETEGGEPVDVEAEGGEPGDVEVEVGKPAAPAAEGGEAGEAETEGSEPGGAKAAGGKPAGGKPAEPKAAGGKPAKPKAAGDKPAKPKAAAGKPAEPDWQTAPAVRRSGFFAGIALGPSFGGASGYPNDAIKIDREEHYTNTGVGFGGSVEAWIGGALADWFSFGLGGGLGRMINADHRTDFISGILRLEVFPLFSLGEQWREVGLLLTGGVGFSETNPLDSDTELIFSGGASRLGLGAFWEGIRLWQISMGPFASADFIWSPSALRPMGWVGWRTALYTGP